MVGLQILVIVILVAMFAIAEIEGRERKIVVVIFVLRRPRRIVGAGGRRTVVAAAVPAGAFSTGTLATGAFAATAIASAASTPSATARAAILGLRRLFVPIVRGFRRRQRVVTFVVRLSGRLGLAIPRCGFALGGRRPVWPVCSFCSVTRSAAAAAPASAAPPPWLLLLIGRGRFAFVRLKMRCNIE